jgi:ABC-2 type transport system ATP-binding protein
MPVDIEAKATALLKLFELWDSWYQTMSAYSKGMRQRVLLAAALMHDPALPCSTSRSGLDVNAAALVRTLIRSLRQGRRNDSVQPASPAMSSSGAHARHHPV